MKQKAAIERYVALLRGVNVGGKNKLPMRDLAEIFAAAGCGEVETYIQSGNVVFSAPSSLAARLPGKIAAQIAEEFGFATPVVLRTAAQLAGVLLGNPFLKMGAPEDTLHVFFLQELPSSRGVASLDPSRSPGDSFVVRGREIYLQLPNGMARSKLTNSYFDSRLATISTARNWRTVKRISDMCTPKPPDIAGLVR